jgi:hypothetical protein
MYACGVCLGVDVGVGDTGPGLHALVLGRALSSPPARFQDGGGGWVVGNVA